MGPELWGDPFLAQWENKHVGAFFTRIQTTMPEDEPGSLSENEALDIIAYVLQTNGFPAGDKAHPERERAGDHEIRAPEVNELRRRSGDDYRDPRRDPRFVARLLRSFRRCPDGHVDDRCDQRHRHRQHQSRCFPA